MIEFEGAGGLIVLAIWIFCFIDVVVTPETLCRNLPKLLWIFLVLLVPPLGPIAWLIAGHPWVKQTPMVSSRSSSQWTHGPQQPVRRGAGRATNPDDDQEFLDGLRRRAEEQRRRAREQGGADNADNAG